MKFSFFDYLCANHYGMHMIRRFKVITMTVCIGYMVAIAFGLAPQLVISHWNWLCYLRNNRFLPKAWRLQKSGCAQILLG